MIQRRGFTFEKIILNGYIQIPRGLYEKLVEHAKGAGIDYEVLDERQQGKRLNVSFKGGLRDEQKSVLEEFVKYDNEILHATTAFGKNVVCSAVIAEKKVRALILLDSMTGTIDIAIAGSLCKMGE